MAVATLAIKRFWTEYVAAPTEENALAMRGVDWVEYGPVGSLDRSTTCCKVSSLLNVLPMVDRGNTAVLNAHERLSIIKPAYDAWKTGQEAPINGTPLAAWNGLSPEQAEVLRARSVRTVEELAALGDAHLERIPLPNLREIIKQANRFLQSADTVRYAQELANRDGAIEKQGALIADQAEQIRALMSKVSELADMVVVNSKPANGKKAA